MLRKGSLKLKLRLNNDGPFAFLGVYDSTGSLVDSTGDFLAPFLPNVQRVDAICGGWALVYNTSVPTFQGADLVPFNEGEAFVYDIVTQKVRIHKFQCEPRPNVCDDIDCGPRKFYSQSKRKCVCKKQFKCGPAGWIFDEDICRWMPGDLTSEFCWFLVP